MKKAGHKRFPSFLCVLLIFTGLFFPGSLLAPLLAQQTTGSPQRRAGPFDAGSPIPYFIEDGKGVPGYESGDRELAEFALNAWSRESGGRLKFVRAEQRDRALIRVQWISPADGRYGEMERILVAGKPGAIANITPDTRLVGGSLAAAAARDRLLRDTIVYLTCVHELGHAIGLQHTDKFADIMYSFAFGGDILEYFSRYRRSLASRADIAKLSGVSAADTAALRALY